MSECLWLSPRTAKELNLLRSDASPVNFLIAKLRNLTYSCWKGLGADVSALLNPCFCEQPTRFSRPIPFQVFPKKNEILTLFISVIKFILRRVNRCGSNLLLPMNNPDLSRPISANIPQPDLNNSRAAKLKQLLLDLSKDEEHQDFRSILREAADRVRQKAFGFNRSVTKRKILNLIREFEICEMDDFLDELKLPKKEIAAALDELEAEKKILVGKRRRFQEAGKHFNLIYKIQTDYLC